MHYSPENAELILKLVDDALKQDAPPQARLKKLWWLLLFSRAREITNGLRQLLGSDKVYGGPFKGMHLVDEALRLYQAPALLGCYERELHPTFEKAIEANYDCIINIGCSVGYYAVGLARRLPNAVIEAFDIDPEARRKCADMARANGVEDRVHISGQFYGEDFAKYAERKTLALVDIEGGEKELLDPVRYPALQKMDVIVEMHDLLDPQISKIVGERFAPSHTIEVIKNRTVVPDLSGLFSEGTQLESLDHFLLGWEGREGPTPWGVFLKKN